MRPDMMLFAAWLEGFIKCDKNPEYGYYRHERLTMAGIQCVVLYLLRNGVFETEREMAITYSKETGRLMPVLQVMVLTSEQTRRAASEH